LTVSYYQGDYYMAGFGPIASTALGGAIDLWKKKAPDFFSIHNPLTSGRELARMAEGPARPGMTFGDLKNVPGALQGYDLPRKYRRMNPGNIRALRRSMRRVQSFAKLARKTISFTQRVKMKKGRRR